jgi:hypothetical protein
MSPRRLSTFYRRARHRSGRWSPGSTPTLRVAASPRHSRRRRIGFLAGAAVASLIVAEVALQVVDSSGPANVAAGKSWVAAVGPLAASSASLGATVQEIRIDALHLGRQVLDNDISSLVLATEESDVQFTGLGLAAPSQEAGVQMGAMVSARSQGARLLASGIDLALGSGTSSAATNELFSAGEMMAQSDVDYERSLAAVPAPDGSSALPASQWIADSGEWTTASLQTWVSQLQAAPALRTRHAISLVAVSIDPPVLRFIGLPPTTSTTSTTSTTTTTTSTTSTTTTLGPTGQTGSTTSSTAPPTTTTVPPTTTTVPPTTTTLQVPPPGAIALLGPTTSIDVVAVISNSGNVTETNVSLTASLTLRPTGSHQQPGHSIGANTHSTRALVGTLPPGASRYLLAPALAVVAGATYQLTVTASAIERGGITDVASETFVVTISG